MITARQLAILAGLAVASVIAAAVVLRAGTPTVAADRRGELVVPGNVKPCSGPMIWTMP